MDDQPRTRPTPQLVLGILVRVLGTLFTLDNLDLLNVGNYFRFWPVLVIVLGFVQVSQPSEAPSRVLGLALILGGVLILLRNLDVIHFRIWDFWPLILVFLGVAMVWGVFQRRRDLSRGEKSTITAIAVLGGVQRTCSAQDFRGGELTAIMGGCEIDLRDADMQAEEAALYTFALWGGIEIKVPESWTVIIEGLPLMGGFDERTHAAKDGPKKTLRIKGLAIMGGVEIRN